MAANWQDHQLVIDIGAEGTYDITDSNHPSVIKDGSTYKMWYAGRASGVNRIIYCTSTDGITWTGHTMVVDRGAEGTYDTTYVYSPSVIKDGSTYKMWYAGLSGSNLRILYCTSTDGITWTGHTMVVNIGAEGSYDTTHSVYPAVIKDESTYKMWYTGLGSGGGGTERIIYCTSTNGTTWTGHTMVIDTGSEGTYDTDRTLYAWVIKDGSTYKMWYVGAVGTSYRAIYCTSTNGTTWTDHTMVVDMGDEGTYDTDRIFAPSVIKDGSTYKMWYAGRDATNLRIIYTRDISEVPPIPTIAKYMGVSIENLYKIFGVAKSGLSTVVGLNVPAGGGGDRGIFGGGQNPAGSNIIDYITISTTGNAQNFGDLSVLRYALNASSNGGSDRGIFGGGFIVSTTLYNTIDYVTISSISDAVDFGDLTTARRQLGACSNGTNDRGVFAGGGPLINTTYYTTIDYVTISSIGNATSFGGLSQSRRALTGTSNGTNDRGVFAGGYRGSFVNTIDYITISSTGNATNFGDLTELAQAPAGVSNGTNNRGVFGGRYNGSINVNTMDYITISSIGNAQDFGDLTSAKYAAGATSNSDNDRGVFGGGHVSTNSIDYITISSIGNAQDFGDLTLDRYYFGATSNA